MRRSRPRLLRSAVLALALIAGSGCARDPLGEIRSLQEEGRFEASIEPLEQLLDERPHDPELQYLYGIANLRTGRFSLALWPLREARENPEWAQRAGEALAIAALESADEETAIEAATRVLEKQSDHRDMLNVRVEARLRANAYEEALKDIAQLEALDPDDEHPLVMKLRCLIGMGKLDEAEALFLDLEKRASDPDFPGLADEHYCAARASFAKEKNDYVAAEQRFGQCLEAFPESPLVVREAVSFFDQIKRFDRSFEILRGVLALDAANAEIREMLATRLRERGEPKQAEELLLEGTQLDRDTAYEAWGGLASHYFQTGDYARSVEAWEQVLALVEEPGVEDRFGYAEALLRAGQYDRAVEVAKELPEANAEIIRGLALLEQDRPAEALQRFDAGLRLWPNHAVARRYAAVAAERAGDFDRAISEYRQSIRSGAEQTDAGLRLAELHEAEGAYERAFQAITLHQEAHPNEAEGTIASLRIGSERSRGRVRLGAIALPERGRAAFVAKVAEIIAKHDSPDVAVRFVREAPEIDLTSPDDAEALRALVVQLSAAGKGSEARAQVEKALAAHPDSAAFHAIRALALELAKASEAEVRAEYVRAVELDANSALALAALARLDRAAGKGESARSFYQRAAAADPHDLEARRSAAELALAAGDLDDAQRRLESLLEDRPYDAATAADLAALLVQRGADAERARSLARQAVRFRGGAKAYALLVQTHLDAGRAAQAVTVLSAAAERNPKDASLQYQLGRALAAANQRDAARAAFEKALASGDFPERSDAQTALAALSDEAEGG